MPSTSSTPAVGFLYPGYSAEDDYPAYQRLLGDEVTLRLTHTLMREDAHRVDALLDVGGADVLAPGARELREQGIDAIVWACTSGSFVFGWQGATEQARAVGEVAGVPASSTSFAFVNAARALGVRRVAIAATYPQDVAERFEEFLTHGGVEVTSLASRGIVTAAEVGKLDPDEAVEFVAANDHPDAHAVLVPDTALHSAGLVQRLEQRLDKPVLCANQVSVWEGLRRAGHRPPADRPELGALFSAGGA